MRLILSMLVSCCLAFPVFAADDEPVLTDAVVRDIGQTYGFCLGQSFLLDAIGKKFPEISQQARIGKLQFDASFGASITNMEAFMARRDNE